jgi:hypothetical protein
MEKERERERDKKNKSGGHIQSKLRASLSYTEIIQYLSTAY